MFNQILELEEFQALCSRGFHRLGSPGFEAATHRLSIIGTPGLQVDINGTNTLVRAGHIAVSLTPIVKKLS